jgi:hypothetical protein
MIKPWKIIVAVGFAVLIAFIVYSSMGLGRVNCEICMEFHGRTSCQVGAGMSQDEAVKTAQGIACSELAAGRTENIACDRTPAKTVSCK